MSNNNSPPAFVALCVAARAVAEVLSGRVPDPVISQGLPASRAAALDLTYTTLRDFGRGDFLLSRLMKHPPENTEIHGLLLVAFTRLELRPESAHTTVDQAVTAAGAIEQAHQEGRYKGLVNGVLRNFLRHRETHLAAADADETAHWRHPPWWIERLRTDHPDHWRDIAASGNLHPPMTLRPNTRRTTLHEFQSTLEAASIASHILDESIVLERPVPVNRLPGFADGLCSVQDYGAQQAAKILGVEKGMRVLDASAAPGGKTAHLLELADCDLLALDVDKNRAVLIHENLRRLGLSATVKVADCRDLAAWWDGQPFDRILADVPCSASGVARRHPDIKWLRRSTDIAGFARTQTDILEALWQTLALGGRMLYATCSVFSEENEQLMAAFLKRHSDAALKSTHSLPPNAEHDGFYYALLERMTCENIGHGTLR
ncbi:MAG: 16S rRNA (cytosine(967)-C(5))-methyltransferase RsmB [Rhodocyclaceae bacterium]|nr:16S rRNA (cytosine(967)-C(5))-methyltransferase RsmB [Rhodocyclaceae bacterium]